MHHPRNHADTSIASRMRGRSLVGHLSRRRALSLIEMVVSIGLVGLVLVAALNSVGASKVAQSKMNNKLRGLQAAQELLNEILTRSYADPQSGMGSFGLEAGESAGVRRDYDDVDDYDGIDESPPLGVDGAEITEFKDWTRRVKVHWVAATDTSMGVNYETGFKRIIVFALIDGMVQAEVIAVKSQGLPALEACCQAGEKCDELGASDCVARNGSPGGAGVHCWSITCDKWPVASWKFEEGLGTTASDSADDHDGTLTNGPIWTTGKVGGAVELDGTNDYVDVPHSDELSLTTSISLSVWMYRADTKSTTVMLAKGSSGTARNYWLSTTHKDMTFGFTGTTTNELTAGIIFSANTWHHLAATFDDVGDGVTLYFDGAMVQQFSTTAVPVVNTGSLYIGRSQNGEYFQGRLDEVRIYNSVLTAEEVAVLAAAGSVSEVPIENMRGWAP